MSTFQDTTSYFVKLSTRSPKDSKSLFKRAGESYLDKIKDNNLDENNRWILLTEEVAKAGSSRNAIEAIEMFLDSERVAEDLKYACENPSNWNLSVVIRSWDPRVTLQSEFRSFVCPYALTRLLTHLLTHSLTHSLTYSLTYLLTYLLRYGIRK